MKVEIRIIDEDRETTIRQNFRGLTELIGIFKEVLISAKFFPEVVERIVIEDDED
jgi:hypothetical protein